VSFTKWISNFTFLEFCGDAMIGDIKIQYVVDFIKTYKFCLIYSPFFKFKFILKCIYFIVMKFDGFNKWRCDVLYGTTHLYLPSIDGEKKEKKEKSFNYHSLCYMHIIKNPLFFIFISLFC
jgi:hypothetical protein